MSVILRALDKFKSTTDTDSKDGAAVKDGMTHIPNPATQTPTSPLQRYRKPMFMALLALGLSMGGAGVVSLLAPKPEKVEPPPPPPPAKPEIQSRPPLPRTAALPGSSEGTKGLPLPATNRGGLTPPPASTGSGGLQPPTAALAPPPPPPTQAAPNPLEVEPLGEMPGTDRPSKQAVDPGVSQPAERPRREERKTDSRPKEVSRNNPTQVREAISRLKTAMASQDATTVEDRFQELEKVQGKDGLFLLKMRGFWSIQRGEYVQAERYLERILAVIPDDADANLNLAVVEAATQRVPQAEARLKEVIRLHPEDPRPRILLERLR